MHKKTSNIEMLTFKVPSKYSGSPLIDFLYLMMPHFSKKKLKQLIDNKCVRVNNLYFDRSKKPVFSGAKVVINRLESLNLVQSTFPQVVYSDEHIVCISKPSGYISSIKLVHDPVYLVHRLDKETSGCMIFAKSRACEEELLRLFKERLVEKKYLAVVNKMPSKQVFCSTAPIAVSKSHSGFKKMGIISNGKAARTDYEMIQKADIAQLFNQKYTSSYSLNGKKCYVASKDATQDILIDCHQDKGHLILAKPKTGRTHQIRLHLSHLGLPIVGDMTYGGASAQRVLLHAHSIEFTLFTTQYTFTVYPEKVFDVLS